MNNRIQELAEQARVSLPIGRLSVTEWIQAYNLRLGELIVEDVLNIVTPRHDERTETFRTHRHLYNSIQQHFGINEDPCSHHWIVNESILGNGWVCDNCYETTMTNPNDCAQCLPRGAKNYCDCA